jgi:hypothetical protein
MIEARKGGDMKKNIAIGLVGWVVTVALISGCMTPRVGAGAKIGGIVGAVGGAIIDDDNPWRGAVLGAAGGAILGGVIGNIVDHAAEQAARERAPVAFERVTPRGQVERVEARPAGVTPDGTMQIISVKHIRDGVVVKEEIRTVPAM